MCAVTTAGCHGCRCRRLLTPRNSKFTNWLQNSSLRRRPLDCHPDALSFGRFSRPLLVTESSGYHLKSMNCRALPVEALPHQPKLLRDYVHSFERVAPFFPHKTSLENI